jgi:hypothetical protein
MFNDTERLGTKDILSMLTEPVNRLDRGLCAFYKVSVGAARTSAGSVTTVGIAILIHKDC